MTDRPAETQVAALEAALDRGAMQEARAMLRRLQGTLDESSLQPLQLKLRELEDWHTYATLPKRETLCESMEAIAASDMHDAEARASDIKSLQKAWRDLGPSNATQTQRLWQRFKAAGDLAYAPCAAWFEKRGSVRDANLGERTRACETIERLCRDTDWTAPDWADLDRQLRRAQKQWRKHSDIPHAERRALGRRYKAALRDINQRLDEERSRNHASKARMADAIEAMLAAGETREEMIPKVLQLQQDWKAVGISDRRIDQQIWTRFRAACDRVFAAPPTSPAVLQLREAQCRQRLCLLAESGDTSTHWPVESLLPPDIHAAFNQRFEAALRGDPPPDETDMAETLCVEAEMLAELESPPEAESVRMSLQIQRLEAGLADRRQDEATVTELQLRWLCLTTPESALAARFDHAIKAAIGSGATPGS